MNQLHAERAATVAHSSNSNQSERPNGNLEENSDRRNNFRVNIPHDTENIVLTDSQGKFLNRSFLFGKSITFIRKCSNADQMSKFAEELGQTNPRIKNILINNGVNDMRVGKEVNEIASEQWDVK